MRERRENGLCYNGAEKWNPAHKCKSPTLYLMHGHDILPEEHIDDSCEDL
jgi:hypothetical protein